jgi:hypothetical protein
MNLSPAIIVLLVATTLPATASEFKIAPRAMQIIIGNACQSIEDGESKRLVYREIREELSTRGLTELQIRQAAKVIGQNVQSICGGK